MKIISMKRKLTLSRETVRSLTEPELTGVAGGAVPNLSKLYSCVFTWCNGTCYCPTTNIL